ncbi:MAG: fibronectin type III domain-containing protein [Treponema sp.]|jgi:hypothetical protein|nr:fibronectin type III domain-containing protein [Treponema sp.]
MIKDYNPKHSSTLHPAFPGFFLFSLFFLLLLVSCPNPSGNNPGNKPVDPVDPDQETKVVFDNTQGICGVSVYDDYRRREDDKIAEVPAGRLSAEIKYAPGDKVPFYFSYNINLKGINGFSLNYVPREIGKDQIAVRIDEGITTVIPIPTLDETVSSPDELLSNNSYLLIQNNSSYSFELHRGNSGLRPDNASGAVVNSGDRALYTINSGTASVYQLLVGADYKPFPGSIASFEAGLVYSFVYDGNISLTTEVEIILENVAGVKIGSAPEAPGAPAVRASDTMLTLSWVAVEGAENYEVYLNTDGQPPYSSVKTVPGTTTVLNGLSNRTVYYIWIKATNSSGSSDFSPRVRGIPWSTNDRPWAPSTLVIIPGITMLTVNWEESGGAASYEVYINTSPSAPSVPVAVTDKTGAVIMNLENDKIYYIWVKAVNNAGKSDYSAPETGNPKIPDVVPGTPAMPVTAAGNRRIAISWQAAEFASAYEVWYGTTNNSAQAQKFGLDITGGITETVITGLTNETTYYVWIKAKNVVGTSGFSPLANMKPSAFASAPERPAAPTINAGSHELSVSWLSVEGSLSYEVWAGLTNNPANALKQGADVSDTSVTLNGLTNETVYYIWVKAKNNIGVSEFSPVTTGSPSAYTAPPEAPLAAPTVIAGNGQVMVSWQQVEGASSYEVWAGDSPNPVIATKRVDDAAELSAVVTGLTNGTVYYVWVKAKNGIGVSGFSPMASVTPIAYTVAPQAPSAPSVIIGDRQLTVNWTAVAGAAAYEVWLGTSNNSAAAIQNGADVSSVLSVTIDNLTNGTTYYVWLKAKNSIGTSSFSPVASGKPIGNMGTVSVSAERSGELTLNWEAVDGADQYEVFYGTAINPPQNATLTINAPTTSAVISNMANGITYNVWIRGKNSTGTGSMSAVASAMTIGSMGTVTVSAGDGQLLLSWPTVAGADEYEVYYSTAYTIPANPALLVETTTATISGLSNGTAYYVWVKGRNANGTGSASAAVSGMPMAAPDALTVSTGNGQITISWTAVPGANSYEVYYSTDTTLPATASFIVMGTSRIITGLTNGTTYNFWVKVVYPKGTSGASPMASGTPIGTPVASDFTFSGLAQTYDGSVKTVTITPKEGKSRGAITIYYDSSTSAPSAVGTYTVTFDAAATMGWNAVSGLGAGTLTINVAFTGAPILKLTTGITQLTYTWTESNPDADSYDVYWVEGSGQTAEQVKTGTKITNAASGGVITGLDSGMAYSVLVTAIKAGYTDIDSTVVTEKTTAPPTWAKTVSAGSDNSCFNAVAADSSGNVYAAGYQYGTGVFSYGEGVSAQGTYSFHNVVLVKYNASGTAQWAKTVSAGSRISVFNAVATDSSGNVYAAGYQNGTGAFSYGAGVSAQGSYIGDNVVLVKYNASGTAQWAKTVSAGSDGYSSFNAVAVDSSGNVYAAGFQLNTYTYTYGAGVSAKGTNGGYYVVLVKYDASGTAQWAKTVSAGNGDSYFNAVAADSSGNVYAAGSQYGNGAYTYGAGVSAQRTNSGSAENVVLVKYNASGTAQWARTVSEGSNSSFFYSVVTDSSGNVYAAGRQNGTGVYTYGAGVSTQGTYSGNNVVLVKYDASGMAQWAKTVSAGSDASVFNAVAADSSGNVYAAGYQSGTGVYTYDAGVSAQGTSSSTNAVLVKYQE